LIKLTKLLAKWELPDNEKIFKEEVQKLSPMCLPLQQAMSYANYVCDSGLKVIVLDVKEHTNVINVKAGIFFYAINAGSCCAGDPSTVEEQQEYCEIIFEIDRATGNTDVSLVQDDDLP